MRFALLGNHPDGLAMTLALLQTGRHQLLIYSGPIAAGETLRSSAPAVKFVGDLEEVLADPAIEAVIVAGKAGDRVAQLRRALQSERHVLCVHPADCSPDIAYEAAMIQGDTKQTLFPLITEGLHPGALRLGKLTRQADGPLGKVRLVSIEWSSSGELLQLAGGHKLSLPGWAVLRAVGGEVAEVSAFAAGEELELGEPVLLHGRFESGSLFQASLLAGQPKQRWECTVTGKCGSAVLTTSGEPSGPTCLRWQTEGGEPHEENWDTWDGWQRLVEVFEAAVAAGPKVRGRPPTWQDAIRCLELDDAARRSVERRRSTVMEYPEASEEVGFKGTMTLVGCGLLWGTLLLVVLSAWQPRLGWLIVPVLGGFLLLQLFRWLIPERGQEQMQPSRQADQESIGSGEKENQN